MGLPGSGKTYLAERLQILHTDVVLAMYLKKRYLKNLLLTLVPLK